MIKTGLLPIQIDEETYKILSGHESFEIKLDLETETTKLVQIVINGGDLVLIGNCDSKVGQHEASRVKWHSNFGQFFNGPSNFQPFQIPILKEEVAKLIAE